MTTQQVQSQAGDAVFCIHGAEIGRFATIGGIIGQEPLFGEHAVCFNGGNNHLTVNVAPEDLIFSGKQITRNFWDFGIKTSAGLGANRQLKVNLWYWKGCTSRFYLTEHNYSLEKKVRRDKDYENLVELLSKQSIELCSSLNETPLDDIYLLRDGLNVGESLGCEFTERRFYPRDGVGLKILEAYRLFKKLTLHYPESLNGEKPFCFAYCEATTDNRISFKNKQELDNFITAYKIKIDSKKGNWGNTLLIPNNKVNTWKPLVAVKSVHRQG